MLVPDSVLAAGGAAADRWSMTCPKCQVTLAFDQLKYVNLELWPDFETLVASGSAGAVVCRCPHTHDFMDNVIVELATKNLLVYVVHGGDGPHVQQSFERAMQSCGRLVSRRPYTFVHGWQGLAALLQLAKGHEVRPGAAPYPHSTEVTRELVPAPGYAYGPLFFYDPAHLAARATVQALLEFTATATEMHEALVLRDLFQDYVAIQGAIHPWVITELGKLHLRLRNVPEARRNLELAVLLEHRWLAVTRSFVDATPVRRADGMEQADHLPHAHVPDVLGSVTADRHVVILVRPATPDYGLWHFPQMGQQVVPREYTFKRGLAASGLVHGRLARLVLDQGVLESPPSGGLVVLSIDAMQTLMGFEKRPDLAHEVRHYLAGYILGRWDLAIGSFATEETRRRGLGGAEPLQVLDSIEDLRSPDAIADYFTSRCASAIKSWLDGGGRS